MLLMPALTNHRLNLPVLPLWALNNSHHNSMSISQAGLTFPNQVIPY